MSDQKLLAKCQAGINAWQQAFNQQDAIGCAVRYTADSVMNARPFGTFKGRQEIQAFWQDIMDKGFTDVEYTDVNWEAAEDQGYILSSSWTMNKAFGVVHREHWIIEEDGEARLLTDDFEVQGER
ncbi:nuclear transport factor 2 family protein [Amphritea balenae]|uniref:Isochorismatase n=1 Tax=Amphritea balenae TaxID=452629 RepID=A0A3P1SWI4_9GAMM|nr:nuclear transport factor 2 family protein [Amphritea balenae]RRD01541.1 isochorismatase [Amphritea balenae]GGK56102.1 hypothetical protein GCM10007941_02910 [Amphritea balenae]